ncbi:MAG TPA: hypothetical protein VGJ62_07025 [Gemmatimonadaceae bacterium]
MSRPQIPKQVQVELPEELAIDLAAFSAAYYDAQYAPILRAALRDHIDRTLDAEPGRKRAFDHVRATLLRPTAEPIRLVPPAIGERTSDATSDTNKKLANVDTP